MRELNVDDPSCVKALMVFFAVLKTRRCVADESETMDWLKCSPLLRVQH